MDERAEGLPADTIQRIFPDEILRVAVGKFVDGVSHVNGVGKLAVRKYNDGTIRFYAVWDISGGDRDMVTSLCSEGFSNYAKHNTDFVVIHYSQEEFGQMEENNQHYNYTDSGTIWERSEEAE